MQARTIERSHVDYTGRHSFAAASLPKKCINDSYERIINEILFCSKHFVTMCTSLLLLTHKHNTIKIFLKVGIIFLNLFEEKVLRYKNMEDLHFSAIEKLSYRNREPNYLSFKDDNKDFSRWKIS